VEPGPHSQRSRVAQHVKVEHDAVNERPQRQCSRRPVNSASVAGFAAAQGWHAGSLQRSWGMSPCHSRGRTRAIRLCSPRLIARTEGVRQEGADGGWSRCALARGSAGAIPTLAYPGSASSGRHPVQQPGRASQVHCGATAQVSVVMCR
jgi:hypothetical protein